MGERFPSARNKPGNWAWSFTSPATGQVAANPHALLFLAFPACFNFAVLFYRFLFQPALVLAWCGGLKERNTVRAVCSLTQVSGSPKWALMGAGNET